MNTEAARPPEAADLRALEILSTLETGGDVTQRSLSTRLGVALGLVNAFLKRLARKGYIKVTTAPGRRIRYWLTPKGFTEKSRLTVEYLRYSFQFYRDARARLRKDLEAAAKAGAKRAVLLGTGEMAEIAYLALRETPVALSEIVGTGGGKFLGHSVLSEADLSRLDFDLVLLADPSVAGLVPECRRRGAIVLDPFTLLPA